VELYAIEIKKNSLALVTLLNQGVTPPIEKKKTYFIFDATWNSEVPNEIVTEKELLTHPFYQNSPLILKLKK